MCRLLVAFCMPRRSAFIVMIGGVLYLAFSPPHGSHDSTFTTIG